MSSRKTTKSNLVGNLNKTKLQQTKKDFSNITIQKDTFLKFCEDFLEKDFSKEKSIILKQTYEDGVELLNTYYITNSEDIIEMSILQQVQFIVMKINYEIENRQLKEVLRRNRELNNELIKAMNKAETIEKQTKSDKKEIEHIKNDMKSITTTIISIILAISIIPTAIAGIERMDSNYILPFIATIILFGMVMITFVYSIYQDKIKTSTWIILISMLVATIICWTSSIIPILNINKNIEDTTKEIITETNNQEELVTN